MKTGCHLFYWLLCIALVVTLALMPGPAIAQAQSSVPYMGNSSGGSTRPQPMPLQAASGANADDVYVALSNGFRFYGTGVQWSDYFCVGQEICKVGDVNGDGKDDAIAFVRTNNGANDSDVYVALSDGVHLGAPQKWADYFCTLQEICAVGDVNGDGKADAIAFVRTNNGPNDSDVWVALSNGTTFGPAQKWHDYMCTLQEVCAVGDFNGDGKMDIVYHTTSGAKKIKFSNRIRLTLR